MSIACDESKDKGGQEYATSGVKMILDKIYPNQQNSAWIVQKSKLGGWGLFARKKINKGDLIFRNIPIAIGPRNSEISRTFCAFCYKASNRLKTCEKCGQAMCFQNCSALCIHVTECEFITTYWKRKPNHGSISQILGRMRIYVQLFLSTSEQKQLLPILQHSCPATFIDLENLCESFIVPDEHIEFVKTAHSILKINSFRIPSNSGVNIPLRGLFPLAAFLNHNCVPNTRNVFREDKTMEVYALRDIDIEEEIFSCYTSLLWCTPVRRYQLYKSKNFWCQCVRCSDPSEMGTRLSAFNCFDKDCLGKILPCEPLNPISEWTCDTCSVDVSAKQINNIQCIVGSLLKIIYEEEKIDCDNIVLKRLECFLPHSSHIFVDLHFRWALKLGYDMEAKLKGILENPSNNTCCNASI